jgi:ankyrin repeat protein
MDRHRCTKRHVEVVTTLVELGADIGALNGRGETPLQVSIRGGHHQVARVLRELERSARTKKEAAAKESTKQAIDQAERNAAELIEEEEREEAA